MEDFGLDDWPAGGASRDHAVHKAYCQATVRAGGRLVEYVSSLDVARRDRWACSACGEAVPQRWDAGGLALAPVLVFTVLLAEGGRYARANLRLAHYGCARFADPVLARALARVLAGDPNARQRAGKNDLECIKGHLLAGANLLKSADGRRRCRQCRRDRDRAGRVAGGQPAAAVTAAPA